MGNSGNNSKRTVRTFGLASFLNDMGSDMIYPIWPLFVKSLGADMTWLGFLDGLGDAIVSVSQAVSGYISDRIRKRKFFIWLGYMFAALSRVGYAVAAVWQYLIPFRILDRAGKMRGAPRDAMIADVSTQENRGRNFGFLRAMDNLGAVCGIIICLLMVKYFGVGTKIGFQHLFWIAAIPSVIGVVMILAFVREDRPSETKVFKGLRYRHLDANFKFFLALSVFFSLGAFSYSFLLMYAKEAGFATESIILLYLAFTAMASIASFPFGKLADKIGRKTVLQIGFLFWILLCVVMVFFRPKNGDLSVNGAGFWTVVIVFILYGLHKGALDPVQKAFVSEVVPAEYRASGLGFYQMCVGLCALPASFMAGRLWDKYNVAVPFAVSLALTVTAVIMMTFVKESMKKEE
ncbi:MAG: MFS transporter [Planctomycetes bacterium]|nr:MFS transporter [Planctomycetota bacterium]